MPDIMFVCTGNICRSPTAEGVFRHIAQESGLTDMHIASSGTTGFHTGERPDRRAITAAKARGFSLEGIYAQQVTVDDFHTHDLIFGLDHSHVSALEKLKPENAKAEVHLLLEYADHPHILEVPDPYYGTRADFEHVLDLVEEASRRIIAKF